ncbi:hypothetical protein QJS10_CPA06g02518 [Acorus calamus]|uniref:Uncharacterized protein n=1 Tax=Acorus calamus TaxID=4465 RepID=A0AAV9EHY1_ACOCL|nr:hypothetical protein QJS10_CPA06g02518 [Acorus calamus]
MRLTCSYFDRSCAARDVQRRIQRLAARTASDWDIWQHQDRRTQCDCCHRHCRARDADFTLEEVTRLQKELTKVLARKPMRSDDDESQGEKIRPNNLLPLDKFLNCPSSLEVDRIDRARPDSSQNVDGDPPRNGGGVVLSKGRDVVGDERSLIRRRSERFQNRACEFERSNAARIKDGKVNEGIASQEDIPTVFFAEIGGKKYLEGKATEDKTPRSSSDGSKWVRTDSEYIVLEI